MSTHSCGGGMTDPTTNATPTGPTTVSSHTHSADAASRMTDAEARAANAAACEASYRAHRERERARAISWPERLPEGSYAVDIECADWSWGCVIYAWRGGRLTSFLQLDPDGESVGSMEDLKKAETQHTIFGDLTDRLGKCAEFPGRHAALAGRLTGRCGFCDSALHSYEAEEGICYPCRERSAPVRSLQ